MYIIYLHIKDNYSTFAPVLKTIKSFKLKA